TASLLEISTDQIGNIDEILISLILEKKLVVKEEGGERRIYLNYYYYAELDTARRLCDLAEAYEQEVEDDQYRQDAAADLSEYAEEMVWPDEILGRLEAIEEELSINLEDKQREGFLRAVTSGIMVLTGGPGTGKTTIIRAIIRYFEEEDCQVVLAAPTGRAAKRMQEAAGMEAKTIHRLLEISRMDEDEAERATFSRNEENPLEADVIIIDECSMVDISLMNSLLKAVPVGARLILVGDVDQLPSVGPGNVLRDIIVSERFPVVRLEKIFRQAAMSDIIVNAHKINSGQQVNPAARSRDFLFIRGLNPENIIESCAVLVKDKLPGYVRAKTEDIQIMTPMRKGPLGVEQLNQILQARLNPPSSSKREKQVGDTIYRVGDKVMQIKNNYQLAWERRGKKGIVYESGTGVFNGDTGVITSINTFAEELDVLYDDGHYVTYGFKMLEELELAYAITVHKSQGSEYPAVVLPLLSGPSMLMTRNLLYTAVTRAKSCVCIVGSPETFGQMIRNERRIMRYTSLAGRIREIGSSL
ncbi:MAG: AAA family ATPase, partial [Lachnospiraceae bacterium]|nr:AAA family ATPase [Lachnospiraceae bacterium]